MGRSVSILYPRSRKILKITFQDILKEHLIDPNSALIIEYYRCEFPSPETHTTKQILYSGFSVLPLSLFASESDLADEVSEYKISSKF
jgi:hypothetical protein